MTHNEGELITVANDAVKAALRKNYYLVGTTNKEVSGYLQDLQRRFGL